MEGDIVQMGAYIGEGLACTGMGGAAVGVTQDLTAVVSAVDLVRAAVAELGGKGGGGRPDMAQGGGPDASKAEAAVAAVITCMGG